MRESVATLISAFPATELSERWRACRASRNRLPIMIVIVTGGVGEFITVLSSGRAQFQTETLFNIGSVCISRKTLCMKFANVESAVAALRETAVPLRGGGPRRSRPWRRLVSAVAAGFFHGRSYAADERVGELIDIHRLAKEGPHLADLRALVHSLP